jgi:hypothetical protein
MSLAERREAVHAHFVEIEKFPQARDSMIRRVAEETRTRPETVSHWPLERRSERFSRAVRIEPEYLTQIIPTFIVRHRAPMLTRFLDAAQISHQNLVLDPRVVTGPHPKAALVEGILAIRREFPAEDVAFYLDALEVQKAVGFDHLAEARKEAASLSVEPPDAPSHRVPPTALAPDSFSAAAALTRLAATPPPYGSFGGPKTQFVPAEYTTTDPYLAAPERLSALDHLVRDAAVATASGVEGALPTEGLRSLVEELLRLNAQRHRSHYHLGYLDVLEGKAPDPDREEASERHRGWYVCGAVHALSRRGDHAGILALFDHHGNDVRRVLGDRHEACAEATLPLFEALCAGGRRADALRALVPTGVGRAGGPLMERLLAEASKDLREARPAEAMPILTLLKDAIDVTRRRSAPVDPGFVERVELRHALALRLQGSFDLARAVLERLRESSDPGVAAAAAADLALVSCRLRSLSDVRLPARAADLTATAHTLAAVQEGFVHVGSESGAARVQADVCLGTLRMAEGRADEALAPLERAVAGTWSEGALPEGYGVAARVRLYLGVALAESLEPGRAAEAADSLVAGVRGLPEEAHPYLLARALTALAVSRPDVAAVATRALHEVLGDRLLDAALEAGLLPTHEALREALTARSEDARRPRRARGADAEALLRDALLASDVSRAERALAVLEDLADDAEGRARLLGILADRARFDPAWGAEEALYARVRLLEAESRYRDAAGLLLTAGHEALSRDPERGLFLVDDVLERVEGYGVAAGDPALVARRDALRGQTAPAPRAAREPVGRVYFLGGNEVQERYEEWLTAEIRRRWPHVAVDFDFTGWSSNWGRNLSTIEGYVRSAQAVVVMRFVRTLLGRTVRSLCGAHGKPWIACTGHGRRSLLSAIEQAVALLPEANA